MDVYSQGHLDLVRNKTHAYDNVCISTGFPCPISDLMSSYFPVMRCIVRTC